MSIREQQEYIISALPGVGTALAKPLLEKFRSVKGVVNAEEAELKTVELIGDKKAKKIREIVDTDYQKL
jgi:Fanconi anemia group M protein